MPVSVPELSVVVVSEGSELDPAEVDGRAVTVVVATRAAALVVLYTVVVDLPNAKSVSTFPLVSNSFDVYVQSN